MAGMGASGFLTRLLRTVQDMIDAGITARLGPIIQGGRVKWPYLEQGHGYELLQPGAVDVVILAAHNTGHAAVVFDTNRPYSAAPLVLTGVQKDPTALYEGDYQAYVRNVTVSGCDVYITHLPLSATGFPVDGQVTILTGYAATGLSVDTATGNTGDTTDTEPASPHHHDRSHGHGLTEPVTAGNTGHRHGLTLDSLTVNPFPNEPADRTITVGWIAIGLQTPPS
jgi:hypothetical protein